MDVLLRLLAADRPADINARDNFGRTALYFAASRGRLECVRQLLLADPPSDLEFVATVPPPDQVRCESWVRERQNNPSAAVGCPLSRLFARIELIPLFDMQTHSQVTLNFLFI